MLSGPGQFAENETNEVIIILLKVNSIKINERNVNFLGELPRDSVPRAAEGNHDYDDDDNDGDDNGDADDDDDDDNDDDDD